jgi:predicted PurR-regulated permease PerM
VIGRSPTLNPVIIPISLTFWGWMWEIVGVILAVPILAAVKIFCAHIGRIRILKAELQAVQGKRASRSSQWRTDKRV